MDAYTIGIMFELMDLDAEGKATPEQARRARELWKRYEMENAEYSRQCNAGMDH